MAVNAYLSFFDEAEGESIVAGYERWIEIQGWDWEVEAESSWTNGGGASVGKPKPSAMRWVHRFDTASTKVLGYLCTGKAFPKVRIDFLEAYGDSPALPVVTALVTDVYITRASMSIAEDGRLLQAVDMVFKTIELEYRVHAAGGGTTLAGAFNWDIPAGTASPSS